MTDQDKPIGDSPIGDGATGGQAGAASVLTKRQRIMAAIADRLAGILQSAGFQTDLGITIQEWDTTPLDPGSEDTILEYRDTDESIGYEVVGIHDCKLTVEIRIRTIKDKTLAQIRQYLGDIIVAMGQDVTWTTAGEQLANDTTQQGPWKLDKGQAADTATGAAVTYLVEYTTDPWDPYL